MKKHCLILLALAALCGSARAQGTIVGPGNLVLCPLSAQTLVASATTTQMIAPPSNPALRIYICGWHVTSILGTSSTFQFEYGTGATCGTGTQIITPTFNVTSTAPSADHQSYAIGPNSAAGAGLCVITGTGATGTAVMVYYNQF
jgi:hypothetical protein